MTDSTNPLIANMKLPGRIFQLPSKGFFYSGGELSESIKEGEIHIRPMSALDEITMRNPDQLFSGDAVNEVFKHCVTGIQQPSELLAKDVDAIMLFLRAVTYGPSYEFSARHSCEDAKTHTYVADLDQIISTMQYIDPTLIEQLYTVKLTNGQTVRLSPSRYSSVLQLIKNNETKETITAEDKKKNLMIMLLGIIESVDSISDKKLIEEWIIALPSPLVNRIGEKIEGINNWGANMRWKCLCKDCSTEFDVEIPINPVSFFIE